MKIFVTKEHYEKAQAKIQEYQNRLAEVRADKAGSFQGDTNTWHDNFGYESATRTEKMVENEFFKFMKDFDDFVICQNLSQNAPKVVEIWTLVKVLETNIKTLKEQERSISIVPVGGEYLKNGIYHYRAPVIAPLIGAKVGDVKQIKIPMGEFKMKILSIQRMQTK
jgi:hypothetical protein